MYLTFSFETIICLMQDNLEKIRNGWNLEEQLIFDFIAVKLPYEPVCPSVGGSVVWMVGLS